MPRIAIYDTASKIVVGRLKMRDTRPAYIAFPDTPEGRAEAEAIAAVNDAALMDAQLSPGQAWVNQDVAEVSSGHAYVDDAAPKNIRQRPRTEFGQPTLDNVSYRIGETVTVTNIPEGAELFIDDVSQGLIAGGSFQFQTSGRGYHYLRFRRFPDFIEDVTVKHNRKPRPGG